MYGLSGTGVYINGIDKDSNAYQTGFRSGDRIVSFGDTDISSQEDLNAALESYHVGDTVTIVIERSGRKYSGQFTLAEDIPDTAAGN